MICILYPMRTVSDRQHFMLLQDSAAHGSVQQRETNTCHGRSKETPRWVYGVTSFCSSFCGGKISYSVRGIIVYQEYQSVCPIVGIGFPHSLPRKQARLPPWTQREDGGSHTLLLVRGAQFGRLDGKPGTLWVFLLHESTTQRQFLLIFTARKTLVLHFNSS